MKRSRPIQRAPWALKTPPAPKPDPISAETRALVRARAHHLCELCGVNPGSHAHHRQLRRFGRHGADNIVWVCGTDHQRIHGHPEWSYENGWLVRSTDDPATTPLSLHLARWVLLLPNGTYQNEAA